jgi:hypothetical protein
VHGLAYGPDGPWLRSASLADNRLRIWDVAAGCLRKEIEVPTGQLRSGGDNTSQYPDGDQDAVGRKGTAADGDRIRRVQIICQSAFEAISRFDHPEGLIYCDPPYVHSTREENSRTVYHNEMSDEDHRKLAAMLRRCKARVVLSGYPSSLYEELYAGWQVVTFDIANHAAGGKEKRRETECLWLKF